MTVLGRQLLVGLAGGLVVVVLLALGLWQMRVFEDREAYDAQSRAAKPALPLAGLVTDDGSLGDLYGRQVMAVGHYLPAQEVRVLGSDGSARVLTPLQLGDGTVVAVVRGLAGATGTPPAPPGTLSQTGVFLPTEAAAQHSAPAGDYASVRLPLVAQAWPQRVLPGFITLSPDGAAEQGLSPAVPVLPNGQGSLQNLGYALQWWVFAAFAGFMSWRFVRVVGRRGDLGTLSAQEDA